ncbi:CcoQ/FixQ family Cbb3-type cytochrome c oxidase assembly chaperone [Apibacter sp. B3924]|uniref:CcoQ/FixQ family Cbb3-type cytochrome c oxidase assembly chaperone n=1 Tax=Apibacter mensalis TaxID=1586267 RepID=UPI00132751FD|nr:CcoQ/FixQ family Cbb3-type cytochrome c oxidase assembly chaperone [Apibacter mensalis]MCX8676779.1 CcoQ/FixQ family Cbb3-type cytochrome c oxidase assembly chaperone [Apibacter sp. B3919]MXO24838.1 CcoQ/FixQ family Cbb3-type cytochrome c oxidase assembly chaperone [Apibacter sp. B3924]MXO26082.1 CcoQ/FixQ family Cbb3-type cytochrome c oxidase assembly chaperone [Apibacter sp. B3813]MXO28033.1 CcoQ/FixQ family Cbb3-type cytochrome c oxidase assembly chaperone [Apibacter sp. B3913]MXO29607.1
MLKFYNKIIAGVDNAIIYQSLALLLFVLFFLGVTFMVMNKPKNYYNDMSNLPLEDNEKRTNNINTK